MTTYYVMASDIKMTDQFVYFDGKPDDYDHRAWRTGSLVKPAAEPMVLSSDNSKVAPISDAVLSVLNEPIFSARLREVMASAGVTNIQYVPVLLIDRPSGVRSTDYHIANILGLLDCIDEANSQIDRADGNSGPIESLKRFQLLPNRIQPLPGTSAPPLVFRLKEYEGLVIAHETVKTACERAKVTGLRFVATKEFRR